VRAYPRTSWCLVAIIWLAAVLRFRAFFANRFHADEALFASWARLVAAGRDPLLQTQVLDKPPLLFYLQAAAYPLLGPLESAARLPGLVASLLVIPLTAALAWRISGQRTAAIISALFLALIPLTIQFSATAFIDPVLAVFLLIACISVVAGRPSLAGLSFGLAIATKYQAWLYLPLILVLGWSGGWSRRAWSRWAAGIVPILLLLISWAAARPEAVQLWSQQMANFGGVRLAWSWELGPRLLAWSRLWVLALGLPFTVATLALAFVAAMLRIANDQPTNLHPEHLYWQIARQPANLIAGWLLLYLLGYFLLHWLIAVPIWDRYLLPLMPLLAVIIGIGIGRFWLVISDRPRLLLAGVLAGIALLQAPWASAARNGLYPIGGLTTADEGAAEIGQYLADAPAGTVLYDHWYGWHWRYHLFDRGVYVSWFPHAQGLVEDLHVFVRQATDGSAARFVVLPASAVAQPVIRVIEDAGFRLRPVHRAAGMTLYQVRDGRP
jgi:4-amino-4-deoxy-L-arabinose transferase-like glycosyltransferase